MKFSLKKVMTGAAVLAMAGGGLLGLGTTTAIAAPTTPAWEPDPNAAAPYGSIVLYDSAGNVLTGGSNLDHLADYAAATTGKDPGANRANLLFAAPDSTKPATGTWTTAAASASTPFPSATAPAPLTGTTAPSGFQNPLVSLSSTDANLNAALGGFVLDNTPGYANIIQLRVKDSGPGGAGSGSRYWATDIAFNRGTAPITVNGLTVAPGTWQQLYPVLTTTATSLSQSPPSPQSSPSGATAGTDVTLTATVSVAEPGTTPGTAGTVQFFDGATPIGAPQPVSGGTASVVAPAPSFGTHGYSAKFTPTGGTQVVGSTSETDTYVVNPPQVGTTTSLAGSSTAAQYSSASFTATITTDDSSIQPGSVAFNAAGPAPSTASTALGTVAASNNAATLNLASVTLAAGTYQVTATFTPTSNGYATSTSAPVTFTVTAPTCQGEPVAGASCTDEQALQVTVNPGSLTITTPYTPSNPFVLPAMRLHSSARYLESGPTRFPAADDDQIVVQSSLAGNPDWVATVSGTDLTSSANTIDGTGLGLTGGTLNPSPNFPGTVAFTANPADNPGTAADDANNGVKGGPFTFAASSGGGNGSASMYGTLTLFAPTQTRAGTYNGTITFAVS